MANGIVSAILKASGKVVGTCRFDTETKTGTDFFPTAIKLSGVDPKGLPVEVWHNGTLLTKALLHLDGSVVFVQNPPKVQEKPGRTFRQAFGLSSEARRNSARVRSALLRLRA